jgi:hypothetical protein
MIGEPMKALACGILLFASTGCGFEQLGVLSVHITLEPTPVAQLPAGLVAVEPSAFGEAGGVVDADVPVGIGTVDVSGLPDLQEGFEYVVLLSFASDPREGLPEDGGGDDHGDGHAHGQDEVAFDTVSVEALRSVGDLEWATVFSEADAPDVSLGALRAAMVMLVPQDAEPMGAEAVMVLSGQVDFTTADGGGGDDGHGHSHGV